MGSAGLYVGDEKARRGEGRGGGAKRKERNIGAKGKGGKVNRCILEGEGRGEGSGLS